MCRSFRNIPVYSYRELRPSNIASPRYRHLFLLLYWPLFLALFTFAERYMKPESYTVMHCGIDNLIPFCELFVFPYVFWYVFIISMLGFTLFHDVDSFRKMMYFVILTYSIGLIIFFLFPNKQNMRPLFFEHDNFLVFMIRYLYRCDTNTNVCPSLHVVGAMSVLFTGWNCKLLQHRGFRIYLSVSAFLISISTMFLKQHSVLDVIAGLVISCLAAVLVFGSPVHIMYPRRRHAI